MSLAKPAINWSHVTGKRQAGSTNHQVTAAKVTAALT
jgi:hypothetical protein